MLNLANLKDLLAAILQPDNTILLCFSGQGAYQQWYANNMSSLVTPGASFDFYSKTLLFPNNTMVKCQVKGEQQYIVALFRTVIDVA